MGVFWEDGGVLGGEGGLIGLLRWLSGRGGGECWGPAWLLLGGIGELSSSTLG